MGRTKQAQNPSTKKTGKVAGSGQTPATVGSKSSAKKQRKREKAAAEAPGMEVDSLPEKEVVAGDPQGSKTVEVATTRVPLEDESAEVVKKASALTTNLGGRFERWVPGRFAEQAYAQAHSARIFSTEGFFLHLVGHFSLVRLPVEDWSLNEWLSQKAGVTVVAQHLNLFEGSEFSCFFVRCTEAVKDDFADLILDKNGMVEILVPELGRRVGFGWRLGTEVRESFVFHMEGAFFQVMNAATVTEYCSKLINSKNNSVIRWIGDLEGMQDRGGARPHFEVHGTGLLKNGPGVYKECVSVSLKVGSPLRTTPGIEVPKNFVVPKGLRISRGPNVSAGGPLGFVVVNMSCVNCYLSGHQRDSCPFTDYASEAYRFRDLAMKLITAKKAAASKKRPRSGVKRPAGALAGAGGMPSLEDL